MNLQFHTPYAFLLLVPAALAVYLHLKRVRRPSVKFSSTRVLQSAPRSVRARFLYLPVVMRSAALVLLVVALARPRSGNDPFRNVTEGVAIQMVLDRSGSMRTGFTFEGRPVSRFEVVKTVFTDFLVGDGRELGGRPDDLVGIVAFAGVADTVSPLTHSHEALISLLDELDIKSGTSSGGTAIGDALALGAARLKAAEEEIQYAGSTGDRFDIKSKLIILITDGEHNSGERSPWQGAALAREWGIKIHTIGIVSESQKRYSQQAENMLQQIAELTGGIYRSAHDEAGLRAVYEEIDRLEKTEIESLQYLNQKEYFLPFVLAGFLLLIGEALLSRTLLRRLP
jgi:Ca-activated chloride channel family protein